MKKFLFLAAILSIVCVSVSAQNKGTRMGQNSVNFGLAIGHGTQDLAHFAHFVADFNKAESNLRLRTTVGLMERFKSPAASANLQYLIPITKALYIYPTVGAYAEYHQNDRVKQFSVGALAGAGVELQFSDSFGIFAEGGHHFLTPIPDRASISFGVMFHL